MLARGASFDWSIKSAEISSLHRSEQLRQFAETPQALTASKLKFLHREGAEVIDESVDREIALGIKWQFEKAICRTNAC